MKALFPGVLMIFATCTLSAQSADKFASAVVNHVYVLQGDSLVNLESGDSHFMIKPAPPFGKSEDGYSLKGEKSPVRVKAADSLHFVLKTSGPGIDASILRLYPLKPRKGNRDAVLGTHQDMYFHSKSENNTEGIKFTAQKQGTDIYIVVPASRLSSGEYAFMNAAQTSGSGPKTTYAFYAFGIDQ